MKRIVFCLLVLVFCSCEKRQLQVYILEFDNEEVICGRFSVSITVDYKYPAKLDYVYCSLSNYSNMSDAVSTQAIINDKQFTVRLENLTPNTKYYYQYEYSNGIDLITTDIKNLTTDDYGLPVVITSNVENITGASAVCGGNILDDGDKPVTARGVCWSRNQNPTINDSHTDNGSGIGSYTSDITNLMGFMTYYVRAYATNSVGTNYGEQYEFYATDYPGAICGLFSVSESEKVYFSRGNLQYKSSTNTWKFFDNQYDYIGKKINQNDWGDLFNWSSSCEYHAIINGGNADNIWHKPTLEEWQYIFEERITTSGCRFAKARVGDVNGVILFPDNWSKTIYGIANVNKKNVDYNGNTIDINQWESVLEVNGAVFLPAAGYVQYSSYLLVGESGSYWTAAAPSWNGQYTTDPEIKFTSDNLHIGNTSCYSGAPSHKSVRLIQSAE